MTTGWTRAKAGRSAAMAITALALLTAGAGDALAQDQAAPATVAMPVGAQAAPATDRQQLKLEKRQKKEQERRDKEQAKQQKRRDKEQAKREKAEARQRKKDAKRRKADAGKPADASAELTGDAANPSDPTIQPIAGLTAQQRLARVVELLGANDEKTARVELKALLAEAPGSREALVLQQSIVGNPYDLVPRGSFSYIVTPGDSFITLARDFLGDSYKFYVLARISGIAANLLKPGDTIQIPGRLRDPIRPGASRERSGYSRPRVYPRRVPAAPAGGAAAAATAAAPQADPATALRLRRQGLEQMTAGRIDAAVARLGRAQQLDPDNKAISADLARARRIQGAVRTR